MQFIIKNHLKENPVTLMRRAGYYFLQQKEFELSFIRPLERSGYPRFHLYLKIDIEKDEIIFNLHLDQKRPVYKTAHDHAGEYDGKVVENEAERIKQVLR